MHLLYRLLALALLYLPGEPYLPWSWHPWVGPLANEAVLTHAELIAVEKGIYRPHRDRSPVADLDHKTPTLTHWQRISFLELLRGRLQGQWAHNDPIRWEANE